MPRVIDAFSQFFDNNGAPLVDGWLQFLVSGTNNTDKDTFADVNETIANSNPVQLDASGRCPNVFGTGTYRVISFTNDPVLGVPEVQIQQFDPVEGVATTTYFSTWEAQTVYNIPDIVLDASLDMYRSITNLNTGNDPSLNPENWEQIEFEQIYNVNKTYSEFDRCIDDSGVSYISLVSSNLGNTPSTSPTKWLKAGIAPVVPTLTVYTISGDYTKSSGLAAVIVEVFGGGGGGGGVNGVGAGDFAVGGGGCGGGYSKKLIAAADIGATETMTIGAKGIGVIANAGGNGGTSSFGSHCQATGGEGGAAYTASVTPKITPVNSSGVGSGGDINAEGGVATAGVALSITEAVSGSGGSSFLGGGARLRADINGSGDGRDAVTKGAGGSGAFVKDVATDYKGGDGADGQIIVYEIFEGS